MEVGGSARRPSHQQGAPALGGSDQGRCWLSSRARGQAAGLRLRWCPAPSPGMLAWPRESRWTQVCLSTRSTLGGRRALFWKRFVTLQLPGRVTGQGLPPRPLTLERSQRLGGLGPEELSDFLDGGLDEWVLKEKVGQGEGMCDLGAGEAAGQTGRGRSRRYDLGLGCQVSGSGWS